MMGPLCCLALLSIARTALGGAALGLTFPEFLAAMTGATLPHGPGWLPPFSVGLALAGFLLAWLMYQRRAVDPAAAARAVAGRLPAWAARRYLLDALFAGLYRGVLLAFARLIGWIGPLRGRRRAQRAERATLRAGDRPAPAPDRACRRTTSTA